MVPQWLNSSRSSILMLQMTAAWLLLLLSFCLETESLSTPSTRSTPSIPQSSKEFLSLDPSLPSPPQNSQHTSQTVILPGCSFRETQPGELSVTSCNLLAPFYHSLALPDIEQRLLFAEKDRMERFPLALEMAKQTNADILLLQEVEGGIMYEPNLQDLLAQPIHTQDSGTLPGYDSYLWAPLLPNRPEHTVGLCIAWRSNKHRLLASNCYKRGMIGQFTEVSSSSSSTTGTFAIANVHLPARPSHVLGRLVTMSKTIQNLAAYDVPQRVSPLDGLLMVGGDWNCDQTSITARLLIDGKVSCGNVRDRNYKANVSKAVASRMKHGYRFQDVYSTQEGFRQHYAPVTVSLHGRGPGCMDHLFYTQQSQGPKSRPKVLDALDPNNDTTTTTITPIHRATSKRKSRREKAFRMRRTTRGQSSSMKSTHECLKVESILATISGSNDVERLDIIQQGLPNIPAGFPSDHIPIGALFVPSASSLSTTTPNDDASSSSSSSLSLSSEQEENDTVQLESLQINGSSNSGGVTQSVRRRREAGLQSLSIRRRHNIVLRIVAEWLEEGGVTDMFRDLPLYKNPWTYAATGLTKKSRAPDMICRIHQSLVVIEVTVVTPTKVEFVAQQKRDKYKDLANILPSCQGIQDAGLTVAPTMVLVLDESGGIPEVTQQTIMDLAALLRPNDPEAARWEAQKCTNRLQAIF